MNGRFKYTVFVDVLEDAKLVADPKVYENGTSAQELLRQDFNRMFLAPDLPGTVKVLSASLEFEEQKRILGSEEIKDLALDLYSDGPVSLPGDADETDALKRLSNWHPGVHVAERTEMDGILIHR